jgi:hypothetical protein
LHRIWLKRMAMRGAASPVSSHAMEKEEDVLLESAEGKRGNR